MEYETALFRAVTPGYDRAETMRRVDARWLMLAGRFPIPRYVLYCPSCSSEDVQLSSITYGRHPGTIPGRADVRFKCCVCSCSWTHGVPVSADVLASLDGKLSWGWREIEEALSEEVERVDQVR